MYHRIAVEYECIEEEDWRPDIDDLRKKISEHTRFITIIYPNNPVEALYDGNYLKEVVDLVAEFNHPIVSHEMYDRIILDGSYEPLSKYVKDTVLIGLSRIYLRLHFFTDVFIGWIIGFLIGYLISILLDIFWRIE